MELANAEETDATKDGEELDTGTECIEDCTYDEEYGNS